MTLQQLEYILAVNQFRHFAKAAEYCRVTQPTLSAMIQKLEEELAALFNATSIPLFVFIPMNGEPQLFRGAADKATYKKAIDDFLLKTE